MPFVLSADFSLFPDDLPLGPTFALSSMDFQDNPGGSPSFVNVTKGLHGLQYPDSGIQISLPTSVPWARVHVGQFNTPFTIDGFDSAGTPTFKYISSMPNTYWYVNLRHPDMAALLFTGGGNEAVIVSISALIP